MFTYDDIIYYTGMFLEGLHHKPNVIAIHGEELLTHFFICIEIEKN